VINNFNSFSLVHLISLMIPILIVIAFIILAKKYDDKKQFISIMLAITLILIRSVRYGFDIYYDVFLIQDLFSLHICHIDLILLVICLFKPNNKIFTFTFLIGIPTALLVALFPGANHPEPGLLRAIYFVMSHTMLVATSVYLLIVYKFEIKKKDLYFYYIFSLVSIVIVYIYNVMTSSNFMYLIEGPKNTILGTLDSMFSPYIYVFVIYLILITLFTILYYIYLGIKKLNIS
jgi:hypothetical integral membrane protein (TIGR02206 family)